jgi:ABC-type transport system involved in multi-copper enzyme maturation permease subunit
MIRNVLHMELMLANRRGRWTLYRRIYAGWLILQFMYLFMVYFAEAESVAPVRFVEGYIQTLVIQQILLIFVGVPIFVAGAITEERTRGTLEYLLTTDLSSASIVLGKLLSGMSQAGLLLLAGLPLICFVGSQGAFFDAPRIVAIVLATAGPLFAWAALSILVSVWSRQTSHALVTLYGLALGSALLFVAVNRWIWRLWPAAMPGTFEADVRNGFIRIEGLLQYLNPYFVLTPAWGQRDVEELARRLFVSSLVWILLGVACTGVAIWRLRPAFRRQLGAPGRPVARSHFLFRARVGDDPIRWKEQHIEGLAPFGLRGIPTWVDVTVVIAVTILLGYFLPYTDAAVPCSMTVLFAATLAVGVRASACVSSERERQSWEALLLTPLDLRRLIGSKRRGIIAATYPYLLAFAVPALVLGWLNHNVPVMIITLVGLIATLVVLEFVGAVGVWCSVRSRSSWMALLGTLAITYGGGFALSIFGLPIIGVVVFFVCLFLSPVFVVFGIDADLMTGGLTKPIVFMCFVGLGLTFLHIAGRFNADAQRRAARERIPYWKSGVNCGYAVEQYFEQLGEPLSMQDDGDRRRSPKTVASAGE